MNKKKFCFIITGDMIMSVSAISMRLAEKKAQEYLEENSPMRECEIYSEVEETEINVTDIEI